MKKILSSILILFSFYSGFSQTATSIANGNWMNPLTWNCTCVPLPGYTVTINHAVALDTSWYVPSGSITINTGASLIGNNASRDLLVNGGSFINHGTTHVRRFLAQSGTFTNSGTLTVHAFSIYINTTNTGTFLNIDSMYNSGTFINNGTLGTIDSIYNSGTFTNNGVSNFHKFTNSGTAVNGLHLSFTDFTNTGTFNNSDSLLGSQSFWNSGIFNNLAAAYFSIGNDFVNGNSITHHAVFDAEGQVKVLNSWYNLDTVKGTSGWITVQDSSVNSGNMKGTFHFCDLTPPSSAPFIDYNTGTIANGINWTCTTGINEGSETAFNLFPNPSNGIFTVQMDNEQSAIDGCQFSIYNMLGEKVYSDKIINSKSLIFNMDLPDGIYFIQLNTAHGTGVKKLIINR